MDIPNSSNPIAQKAPADGQPVIVTAAIIIGEDGRILAAQRDKGFNQGKWEFPGGKVEPGESLPECLAREIREELGVVISAPQPFLTVNHRYPHIHINMHSFLTRIEHGNLTVNEHRRIRWVEIRDLTTLDWAQADLPIAEELMRKGISFGYPLSAV